MKTGRRETKRGSDATRAAILKAARQRFRQSRYEDVGLRDIAKDAGVNVMLIGRYFNSKRDLFVRVISGLLNVTPVTRGERATFGTRIAHALVNGKNVDDLSAMIVILNAAASKAARPMLRKITNQVYLRPFSDWLGGKDAEFRAHFILALVGGAKTYHAYAMAHWSAATFARYETQLAALLQSLVDSGLASPGDTATVKRRRKKSNP